MASSLGPSTPASSQKRITRMIALNTCGLSWLRSGWWEKRCQKYWPAISSQVQLDRSVSVKIMRVPSYLSGVSLQT